MAKNIIPIVFAFDENLIVPAEVCISSLLASAKPDTFYDIFILHADGTDLSTFEAETLKSTYGNCNITFRSVGNAFDNAFEIRNITKATYYRLLIPQIITEYDKIIYADVDIIFRNDLSEVYSTELGNNYIAATYDIGMNLIDGWKKHIVKTPGLEIGSYIQAGFLIFNCKKLRDNDMVSTFCDMIPHKYKFQDQDILNISCANRITILPWYYNITNNTLYFLNHEPEMIIPKYISSNFSKVKQLGNLHFNGQKPWKEYCVNFDIWWEFYRKSPLYDEKYHFDFFYNKLDEYDHLTLWKRVKILLRFFVFGRKHKL